MKKLTSLLVALVFIFGLTACATSEKAGGTSNGGSSSDGKNKLADKLIVFNWSEYLPKEVITGFEEEFGVEVVYSTYDSNQAMLAKLKSGSVPYDIVVPSDNWVKRMAGQGLLLELNMDNIPNFKNISDEWKDLPFDPGNKYSVPYMYGTTGIIYNKKKVKKPDSWADLWNPEYKGHVTISEGPKEAFNLMLQKEGYSIDNTPTKEQLKEAAASLNKLTPNLLAFDSTPVPQFVQGQAWIGQAYSGAAGKAWKENKNIGYVLPKEGGVVWMDNMVIPKTSEHQYTAEVFINYILRPEVSKKLSLAFPYSNPNKEAVKLFGEKLKNTPGLSLPAEKKENAEWGTTFSAEKTQFMNRLFQKARVN